MTRNLRVLIYADVDLNIIDGSAIWLTSMANVLNNDPNIHVDVLLKAPIKKRNLISEIENLTQIEIIDTFNHFKDINFNTGNRINVQEAVNLMENLDEKNSYHCIIVRGINLVNEVLKSRLATKTIPYFTEFTHVKDQVTQNELNNLNDIYSIFPNVFVQTPEARQSLKNILNVDGKKFELVSPMIPDYKETVSFSNKNNTLVYTGKFAKDWYTEEILSAFGKISSLDKSITLNIAGDKFQGDLLPVKEKISEQLKVQEGVNWLGAVTRTESLKLINNSDIGIGWRSENVDNDHSVELSTKLLEYGMMGKPVVLKRTKMHENLLGNDYYLFADSETEFISKTQEILYDRKLYRKTAKRMYEACRNYTFSESYKRLKKLLWSFNTDKIKLLFAGHDLKFINMTMEYFKSHPSFEVKIDQWLGHNKHDEIYSKEYLEWADVIFCEWGLGNAVWYSNNKKKGQRLIVRMHLQEKETEHPSNYKIEKIDKIIAISPYIYEEFHRVCKIPREKMIMIYNMIDTKKLDKPKVNKECTRYNIGICGILPSRKRIDKAINIFEKLWEQDKRYKLYVKSRLPQELPWLMNREDESKYFNEIFEKINKAPWKNNVIFDKHGSDMDEWFRKIGYVLSTSDFESFHLAPMEGMASGSVPLVLHWPGAETIYPNEYLFKNEEEVANYITNNNGVFPEKLKDFPKENFDYQIINNKIEELILDE